MSDKIRNRVWEHSKVSGANKLLLLALAEQSDDDGFTWVSYKTLAPMVGVIERQVYRLVDNLIAKGELLVWEQQGQHGGRGYTNIYLVTTGLSKEQLTQLIRIRFELADNEIEPVLTKKGDIYVRLCYQKRVSYETLLRTKNRDTSVTENSQKGDISVTRLFKESYREESKESVSQEFGPGTLPHSLLSICRINYAATTKKQKAVIVEALNTLTNVRASPEQVTEFGEFWRHNWRGKNGDPPLLLQVCELWGEYQQWVTSGRTNGNQQKVSIGAK